MFQCNAQKRHKQRGGAARSRTFFFFFCHLVGTQNQKCQKVRSAFFLHQNDLFSLFHRFFFVSKCLQGDGNTRTVLEQKSAMAIKDKMRTSSINNIIEVMYDVLSRYADPQRQGQGSANAEDASGSVLGALGGKGTESDSKAAADGAGNDAQKLKLSKLCLEVLSEYIEWIDIDLVVNDRYISLFYR